MNTNKGSIVMQSGNDVKGCRSEKVLVQPSMWVFPQYSVKTGFFSLQAMQSGNPVARSCHGINMSVV